MTLRNGRATSFHSDRSLRTGSRLLLRRAEALRRHLPGAVSGEDIGVHQARVATRRLREAVPVLASGLKGSKAGKAGRKIRKVTRALGAVRELDVTLHLVEELMQDPRLPRPALEELRRHVIEQRDQRRQVMLARLEHVDTAKLARRLESVASALDASPVEGWREVLTARLMKRADRLEKTIRDTGQMYAPEPLHDVRIAAKKLRYGLELAAESGVKSAVPLVRRIKRVQDLLGRLHDLQVLEEHIAAVQASPPAARKGMFEALDTVARHVEAECRHLHGQYLMTSASIHDVIEAVRSTVIPEVQRPPRQRQLKMALHRKPSPRVATRSRS